MSVFGLNPEKMEEIPMKIGKGWRYVEVGRFSFGVLWYLLDIGNWHRSLKTNLKITLKSYLSYLFSFEYDKMSCGCKQLEVGFTWFHLRSKTCKVCSEYLEE